MAIGARIFRRWSQHWPAVATVLLVAHAAAHAVLYARLGDLSIIVFRAAPPLIFAATAVTIALAARDVLHGGWRRVLRGAATFPLLALVASSLLSLLTYRVYPSSYDDRMPSWCLALPLDGDIAILEGGRSIGTNAHAGSPSQRYAYDLTTARGAALAEAETPLADREGFGSPVLAPVSGTVVFSIADEPDLVPGQTSWQPWRSALGNHVVLRVDDSALYLVLAHLQRDSFNLRVGDHVSAGAPLGRTGHSGRSDTPRLHVHVQDVWGTTWAEGVPVAFCGYDVIDRGRSWDTARSVTNGMPTGGAEPQVLRARRPE